MVILMDWSLKKCVPCEGGVDPFSKEEIDKNIEDLRGWEFVESENKITKTYKFESYMDGIDFVVGLAKVAENQGHHPDIKVLWQKVVVDYSTHAIKGLSENDFIMAAKSDEVYDK